MKRFKRLLGASTAMALGLGVTVALFGFTPAAQASHETCNDEASDIALEDGDEVIVGVDPAENGLPIEGTDFVAVCHPTGVIAVTQKDNTSGFGTSAELWVCDEGNGWNCAPVLSRTGAEVFGTPAVCVYVNGVQFCEP